MEGLPTTYTRPRLAQDVQHRPRPSLQRVSGGAGLRVLGLRHSAVHPGGRLPLSGDLLPGLLLPRPTDAGPRDGRDGPHGQGLRGECTESVG